MDNVKIEVPALLATASDQQLLDQLNRRGQQVKWVRPQTHGQPPKIKDWVKLGVSPSTVVKEIDCTEQDYE